MDEYKFTNTWFQTTARSAWDQVVPQIKPSKILEVGTYEGASACYMVEKMANIHPIELHCIDTWVGGVEHLAGGAMEAPDIAIIGWIPRGLFESIKMVWMYSLEPAQQLEYSSHF